MPISPLLLDTEVMLNIDLSGIKLIEASAGTGKTYTIANLYLRHILEGKTPSEILVVTFTNAATEELRGRIRFRLHQALKIFIGELQTGDEFLIQLQHQFSSEDAEIQQQHIRRLQLSLRSMDEASISTIHSFCQSVLQNYALFSRQLFESELLIDDDALWQSAVKDWWRKETYQLDKADWLLFQSAIKSFENFRLWINQIRLKPAAQFMPEDKTKLAEIFQSYKLLGNDIAGISIQWHENKNALCNILRHSKALGRSAKLVYHPQQIEAWLESLDEYFNSGIYLPLENNFSFLSADVLHENSKPSKRGSDPDIDHSFFQSVAAINRTIENLQRRLKPIILVDAFRYCSQQVKNLKQKNGWLSYQDQLDLVLEALEAQGGDKLGETLRKQFPVAMIDEFQDTDSIQYSIFRRIYFEQNNISLTLIGDPKQAIYSFRGGDIFTYMQAKQSTGIQHCCLQTNWRSQVDLVRAVNHFFENRDDGFIFSNSIDFSPALAANLNPAEALLINGKAETALTLWHIPADENQKPLSKEIAGSMLNQAVACEITRLVSGGQNKTILIGDKALQNGDIAILVRNAYQGEALRRELDRHGIPAVTIGKEKVFDSDEAAGLAILLKAITYSSERGLLREALTSSLLDFDYQEIARITDDEPGWMAWCEHFRVLHKVWILRGFIPMFQQLLQTFDLGLKLAARNQADRRLTNLLHLGEILQQQSVRSGGIDNLLNWFQKQTHESNTTENELRLETDQALVKIVTIHKSKGLEYPVVFLPYLWDCKSVANQNDGILSFHNARLETVVDLGSDSFRKHTLLADRERLAEDIRLLYVALTRARNKVYIAWGEAGSRGRSGNSGQTALAYLLHSKQTPDALKKEIANGIANPEQLLNELAAFANSSDGSIELVTLPDEINRVNLQLEKVIGPEPAVSIFETKTGTPWKINSFSGLTRDIHQVTHVDRVVHQGDAILDFPAGSHVGLLLHAIFENLDFEGDVDKQVRNLLPRQAQRFALDLNGNADTVVGWFSEMLKTPLIQPGLSLSVLSNAKRLNELPFDFALDHVDINELNKLLAELSAHPVEPLSLHNFRGLLTGIIDLVFEYQGKFYIADYKSNLLGNRLEDYNPDKLGQAMLDRRYDFQSLIYSIALHRYLRQRIPDYDYELHFGGSYYLFLRAMRINTGTKYGVHFSRPELADLQALDLIFVSAEAKG